MTSLRRLIGLPRLPCRIYILILILMLLLAYCVSGSAYQFFANLEYDLWFCYHPKEWVEYLKTLEEKNR